MNWRSQLLNPADLCASFWHKMILNKDKLEKTISVAIPYTKRCKSLRNLISLKKMNKITALLLLLFFSFPLNAQSKIKWSKETKLMWTDFKGSPDEEILAYALTAYKIEIMPSDVSVDSDNNIKDYKSLTVVANFYSNLSWVHTKSDYLLTHEQIHFDIAGLYASKMRTEFEKLKKQKIANFDSYSKVYAELWAECRKTQETYDTETKHGQLVVENDNWIKKITEKIDLLE